VNAAGARARARGPASPTHGVIAWWLVCIALAWPALAFDPVPLTLPPDFWAALPRALVLRPDAGADQSLLSWWATVWLHGSLPHLWWNLAGTVLLILLGWVIRPGTVGAIAWLLAWPLTQVGMLLEPTLTTYVGLSGVLHAGVAVLGLSCLAPERRPANGVVGWVLLAWLGGKLLMENPWAHTLVMSSASAINVAPWAHLSGSVAGALSWFAVRMAWPRPTHIPPV